MALKASIKTVVLLVLAVSAISIISHLSTANLSGTYLVHHSRRPDITLDFMSSRGTQLQNARHTRNKILWGNVKPMETLHPYAYPGDGYAVPNIKSSGYIYAKIYGGFGKIKSSICDLVTISRLINATLVIPEIQDTLRSKGISSRFSSFSFLYNEEQFMTSLRRDIIIVKDLPGNLKSARRRNAIPVLKPNRYSSPSFYEEDILPKLRRYQVVGLILADGGCLQAVLPPNMIELQRLRCRVAFHALRFRSEIHNLGHNMVKRLRSWGNPFLTFHAGLVRDTLAYHGCAELFQDLHSELIQHRRAQMIRQRILNDKLTVDSQKRRENGSCPLMPEEVGLLLRAMGYPPSTIVYIAGAETFGGQRVLIPLRSMFINLVDRTQLCTKNEIDELFGPEYPLPVSTHQSPPAKSEKQLRKEWEMAGPRPRPLPPPPGRPFYQHENEGWYGWITEMNKEPNPSPADLRMQAHRLLFDALDYIVSIEADAFFPGFDNDGSGWPDFSSLVMGQRLYQNASSRTYRPNRETLVKLLMRGQGDMYHPDHNWTASVREHLNRSLGEDGIVRHALLSKPKSFLSHTLPECSCRTAPLEPQMQLRTDDGRFLLGGEDQCPGWMEQHDYSSETEEEVSETDAESAEDNSSRQQSFDNPRNADIDQDDEWDPND